jgi:hypothetical protein
MVSFASPSISAEKFQVGEPLESLFGTSDRISVRSATTDVVLLTPLFAPGMHNRKLKVPIGTLWLS